VSCDTCSCSSCCSMFMASPCLPKSPASCPLRHKPATGPGDAPW
jgi:hypothetical protein